jgi:hypothetical protein
MHCMPSPIILSDFIIQIISVSLSATGIAFKNKEVYLLLNRREL